MFERDKNWEMTLHEAFAAEFEALDSEVQDELLAVARAVELAGPKAGRPHVDTLKGSKHDNMKELRFKAFDGRQVWRAAFAFDPARKGLILVAAAKQGIDEKRFYKKLIATADRRFDAHLVALASSDKSKE